MICPSCGTKNQYYHRFCYYCGCNLQFDEKKPVQKLEKPDYHKKETINQKESPVDDEQNIDNSPVSSEEFVTPPTQDKDQVDDLSIASGDSLYDYLFDDKSDQFDITREMPLRRYRKDRTSSSMERLIKLCASIIAVSLVAFVVFVVFRKSAKDLTISGYASQTIIVSSIVEQTTKDGIPAHKITFNTTNGREVRILGHTLPVKDGRAEIILDDRELCSLSPSQTEDGNLEVILTATVSAPDIPEVTEPVTIIFKKPQAALQLLQPKATEVTVEGDSYPLVLAVESGSQVYINEEDHTEALAQDGRLEKEIILPKNESKVLVTIRVAKKGYMDTIQEIVFKRPEVEIPLAINESSPISSNSQWIKVTGTTNPNAKLTVDLETKSPPEIDTNTGNFTLYVKAAYPGYTPCTISAHIDGKRATTAEIVLERNTTVDNYTSTAWKPDYDEMVKYPKLHNGRHFAFVGNVKDILSSEDKTVFRVNVSKVEGTEQLIWVEYWGEFNFNPGDRIRIFGNRWGNHDGIPRVLAKYLYH